MSRESEVVGINLWHFWLELVVKAIMLKNRLKFKGFSEDLLAYSH